ncbi:LacI family DNA-binding transcriptional regulator [Ornithinimicrobium tianjinense]|uniref:LacI family transcriptional regulator n=1 Tax=Ornithinimicrobium tianjinense TaxID=1195761 RepID=A0A917F0N3_9MICO|nr:LacI family DNA-binding transcriptional regulator [Ornithinimicrobium tianjinense]GGF40593.1 LacI family transcriptional regulator [Ornithinimicrobium tianjinense]
MATIRDVAARAGVSVATASRALNGSGPASPGTVELVRRAADDLGYRVNKAARSLRTQRTDTIGLLLSDVRNPFFSDLAYVIEQAAAADHVSVITMNADERTDRQEAALRSLATQRVDGLIVVPQGGATLEVPTGMPLVLLDRRVDGSPAPVIQSDNELGSRQMIDHLVELGHRDIALVAGPQSSSSGRERLAACLAALEGHGCTPRPEWIVEGDFQERSGHVAAAALLDTTPRPTAVFAGDNLMAVGVLSEARKRGLRIGEDIAVVSFDDSRWFPLLDPPMTAVAQDVESLGLAAYRALKDLVAGRPSGDVVVPTRLVVRRSCTTSSIPARRSA